jgi:hypothetical protein
MHGGLPVIDPAASVQTCRIHANLHPQQMHADSIGNFDRYQGWDPARFWK